MNKRDGYKGRLKLYKRTVTLTAQHEAFLKELQQKMVEQESFSLGRSEVFRACIDYLKSLTLNLKGIKSEDDLLQRIIEASHKKK